MKITFLITFESTLWNTTIIEYTLLKNLVFVIYKL